MGSAYASIGIGSAGGIHGYTGGGERYGDRGVTPAVTVGYHKNPDPANQVKTGTPTAGSTRNFIVSTNRPEFPGEMASYGQDLLNTERVMNTL